MKLENVQFPPELLSRKNVSALFLLAVGLPYAWKRLFRQLSLSQWNAGNDGSASGRASPEVHYAAFERIRHFAI
jgi:hypothetical protein